MTVTEYLKSGLHHYSLPQTHITPPHPLLKERFKI